MPRLVKTLSFGVPASDCLTILWLFFVLFSMQSRAQPRQNVRDHRHWWLKPCVSVRRGSFLFYNMAIYACLLYINVKSLTKLTAYTFCLRLMSNDTDKPQTSVFKFRLSWTEWLPRNIAVWRRRCSVIRTTASQFVQTRGCTSSPLFIANLRQTGATLHQDVYTYLIYFIKTADAITQLT